MTYQARSSEASLKSGAPSSPLVPLRSRSRVALGLAGRSGSSGSSSVDISSSSVSSSSSIVHTTYLIQLPARGGQAELPLLAQSPDERYDAGQQANARDDLVYVIVFDQSLEFPGKE